MNKSSLVLQTLLFLLLFPLLASANTNVKTFEAVYDMYRKGDKLGEGKRSLKAMGDGSFELELSSDIEWLIFSDRRHEVSQFRFNGHQVQPIKYHFSRKGTGKDKRLDVNFFDDGRLSVKPLPKKNLPPEKWHKGLLDEMSMHMQVQLDLMAGKTEFEYQMISTNGRLRTYNLEVIGEEIISTGMGRFKAVKVARIYDPKKFYAQHAWFIPELNYTLARLWRMKKGVEQYDLVLNKYTQTQ